MGSRSKKDYAYTENMKSLVDGKNSALKTFLCREHFELAIRDVEQAAPDSMKWKEKELRKMCEARGIDPKQLLSDRKILEQIPVREEMKESLLQSFYELYVHFKDKDTSAYMERIVRRLAPEYDDDTVRTAILKKFLCGVDEDFKAFNVVQIFEGGKARLSEGERSSLASMDRERQKQLIISKIDDSIFRHEKIELTDAEILLLIADCIEKYRKDKKVDFTEEKEEWSEDTVNILEDFLNSHSLSAEGLTDSEKVIRLAKAIREQSLSASEVSADEKLVKNLEGDFENQLKTIEIKSKSKTGKVIEKTAKDKYRQAKKDCLRKKREAAKKNELDFELLDMCSDLAGGNFIPNGKTRLYLYYFAFAFDMTIALRGEKKDRDRDVEKNLFQDYYNDNVFRFLSGKYSDPKKSSSVEKEPTGEGINYKNFVEAIYVYYLRHNEPDMTPGEKIDRAQELIRLCVERAKEQEKVNKQNKNKSTKLLPESTEVYRDWTMAELLNKKEEELVDYIIKEYVIIDPDTTGLEKIMVYSEELAASDLIAEIMDDLDDVYSETGTLESLNSVTDMEMLEALYGKNANDTSKGDILSEEKEEYEKCVESDVNFRTKDTFEWKLKPLLEERFAEDKEFIKILSKLDERVQIKNGRCNKMQRKRMLMLLRFFSMNQNKSVSTYILKKSLKKMGVIFSERQFSDAISTLINLGYIIKKTGADKYCLEGYDYDDKLQALLDKVSSKYYTVDTGSDLLLNELMVLRLKGKNRITRSELITLHLNYYTALISDEEDLLTFPDIFTDYADTINPILEEARYQPLSQKNIFDMYVVYSLYFYLLENSGHIR